MKSYTVTHFLTSLEALLRESDQRPYHPWSIVVSTLSARNFQVTV